MINKSVILLTVLIVLMVLSFIDYYAPINISKIKELKNDFIPFNTERETLTERVSLDLNEEVYDKEGNKTANYNANISNKNIIQLKETLDNISYCDNINELDSITKNEEIFMNDNYYKNTEAFSEFNNRNIYEDLYIFLFCMYIVTILYILCE